MLRIQNGFILLIFNTGLKLSTFTIKHTGSEVGYLQISQNIRKLQECQVEQCQYVFCGPPGFFGIGEILDIAQI